MAKEAGLWRFLADRLDAGEQAALLIVAESHGSSPGRAGYKLAVGSDGELYGSIGGGAMEVNLVEEARAILKDGLDAPKIELVKQEHRKNSDHPSGMICSGEQTIIRLILSKGDIDPIQIAISEFERGNEPWLHLTETEIKVYPAGLEEQHPPLPFFERTEDFFTYQEKLGPKNDLFIIGGGHCALELSRLVSGLDFHIYVYDDRPNLNTIEKNEFADRVTILENYDTIGPHIPSGNNVYVVVMTLGYRTDEVVIRKLLGHKFKYFGVLGSKAKMATLLRNLKNEGVGKDVLDAIRTPIGLPINSHTPEEIAVSIAAEIISVKNS